MRTLGFVKALSVLVVAAFAALNIGGCSVSKQFSETASPLAEMFYTDMQTYAADNPAQLAANDQFITAVRAGDKTATVANWYGAPPNAGFRDTYIAYFTADPKYKSPGGSSVLRIKANNVTTFDYILSIGDKPAK